MEGFISFPSFSFTDGCADGSPCAIRGCNCFGIGWRSARRHKSGRFRSASTISGKYRRSRCWSPCPLPSIPCSSFPVPYVGLCFTNSDAPGVGSVRAWLGSPPRFATSSTAWDAFRLWPPAFPSRRSCWSFLTSRSLPLASTYIIRRNAICLLPCRSSCSSRSPSF